MVRLGRNSGGGAGSRGGNVGEPGLSPKPAKVFAHLELVLKNKKNKIISEYQTRGYSTIHRKDILQSE